MKLLELILVVSLQIFLFGEIVSNNYEIILDNIEILLGAEDQLLENVDMRIKKFNRSSYVVNGVLRLKRKVDNSLKVGFKAYNLAGGQYKLMFSRILGPACEMLYEDSMRPTLEEFFKTTNLSHWEWGMCPIEETTGMINNYAPTSLGDHIPPYVPGGEKWKLSLFYVNNDTEIIGGVTVYGTLRTNYSLMTYGG